MLQSIEAGRGMGVLVPGFHAPKQEVAFVDQVIHDYIKPKYDGPIKLVGGRAALDGPRWISFKRFDSCQF